MIYINQWTMEVRSSRNGGIEHPVHGSSDGRDDYPLEWGKTHFHTNPCAPQLVSCGHNHC